MGPGRPQSFHKVRRPPFATPLALNKRTSATASAGSTPIEIFVFSFSSHPCPSFDPRSKSHLRFFASIRGSAGFLDIHLQCAVCAETSFFERYDFLQLITFDDARRGSVPSFAKINYV